MHTLQTQPGFGRLRTWAAAGLAARYTLVLRPVEAPLPILADHPDFVEPLQADARFQAPAVVDEPGADLSVRAWRWWYNARAILETENRLDAGATAVVVVHPWGIDDGAGLRTPEPAGVSFLCTPEKNRIAQDHMRTVLSPLLERLRSRVALVAYSLPGTEDGIRKQLYASIDTPVSALNVEEGKRRWQALLRDWTFVADPLPSTLELDTAHPVASFNAQTPATGTGWRYDRDFRTHLPMPVSASIQRAPADLVFYDDDGYNKVKDFLKVRGIRHILLAGYNTDLCVIRTTCGYENLSRDFNVFLVGDATLATFPASTTPRFATQVALANAALTQLVTQASWVRFDAAPDSDPAHSARETRP